MHNSGYNILKILISRITIFVQKRSFRSASKCARCSSSFRSHRVLLESKNLYFRPKTLHSGSLLKSVTTKIFSLSTSTITTRLKMTSSNQDEIVNSWIDLLKIPVVTKGLYTEDENVFSVQGWWSVDDVTKKDKISYTKSLTILKNSLEWPKEDGGVVDAPVVISSKPVTEECKLSSYSPSGLKKAVVIEKSGDEAGQPKRELLQLWNDDTLLKTYDLNELDKHKGVFTSGAWGCRMVWNKAETKLAYLAEKKLAKAKPFFTSYAAGDVSGKDKAKDEETAEVKKAIKYIKGEEYILKQTWGEQLNDNHLSVIVVLDLEKNTFNVLELAKEDFPMDIQWAGDSIIATSVLLPIWRLGLIFCSNRESRILKVDSDGKNLQYLSAPGRAVHSPRVRPDGNYVVWQERDVGGPHERARSVIGYDLLKNDGPVVLYGTSPSNEVPIYSDFSSNCWSQDSSKLFVATPNEAEIVLVVISVGSEPSVVKPKKFSGILWIGKSHMLIACSSVLESPTIQLMDITSGKYQIVRITKPVEFLKQSIRQQNITGDCSPASMFFGPDSTTIPQKSIPLIVWPHGGPHAVLINSFVHEFAFFLNSGYALLLLNYIGSTGGKKDVTDELCGHIGEKDVQDCQKITEQIIKSVSNIDGNKVVVCGGSHGGFLTAQLITKFPGFYKSAVMRNPVIDLGTMVGTTDITDWVYVESGVKQDSSWKTIVPASNNLQDAKEYYTRSPIIDADKVQTPALLLLGTEDLRVPMSQGIAFYRALLARNKPTDVRIYKDCHSLSKVPVRTDALINWALWFQDNLKNNGN